MQRASAVLLLPLGVWFLWSLAAHAGGDYVTARDWLSELKNTILLGALVTIGALHMRIGMSEVIHDYFTGTMHGLLSWLNWLLALGVIGVALWSLYALAI